MSNHLIYNLFFVTVIGFFALNLSNFPNNENFENNTFTSLDFENQIQQDSTPSRSRSKETYRTNNNGKRIHLSIVNGKIKKLKINGKRIPSSEYEDYNQLIEDLRNDNNTPTSPPTPPTPPSSFMDEIEEAHQEIEKAHKKIEEAHKEIEKVNEKIGETHRELERKNESTSDSMVQALIDDGIIKNEKKFKIYLTKKKFKVNGKIQNKTIHQKYLKLYEQLNGKAMSKNSTYQVSKNKF